MDVVIEVERRGRGKEGALLCFVWIKLTLLFFRPMFRVCVFVFCLLRFSLWLR